MKVHLVYRLIVRPGLRLGKNAKDLYRQGSCAVRKLCLIQNICYFYKPRVRVMVLMVMPFPMSMLLMLMVMPFPMSVRFMLMVMPFSMSMLMVMPFSMQILHIMVMIFMFPVQYHMKVAGVNACLPHPRHRDIKSRHKRPDAVDRPVNCLSVRPQIQQGADCHIPADPRIAFQI